MKLYLGQHGEAKPKVEDSNRPLTAKGLAEVEDVANLANMLHVRPVKILHSEKLRAKQTAQSIASILDVIVEAKPDPNLGPTDNVKQWVARMSEREEDLMLIGHLPFMDKLSAILLSGDEDSKIVQFRYGTIICIDRHPDGVWRLKWIIAPDLI